MDKNDDALLKLYNLAEITYEKRMSELEGNNKNLYPNDWYEIKNYKQKIEIIVDSIKNNELIINNLKYKKFISNKISKRYIKE